MEVTFGQAETLVDDAELTIGGSGAIMACAAARLGLRTALVGLVGPDQFGEFMLRAVSARGVDVSGVVVSDEVRTGLTVVLTRPDDRAILTFPGAIAAMTADRVDAGWWPVRGTSTCRRSSSRPAWRRSWRTCCAPRGPAGRPRPWTPTGIRPRTGTVACARLLPEIDVLLPNAVEACRLAGVDDASAAAARLAELGPLVAVKLGAEGAVAAPAGGGGELVHALPPQRVVDPVDAVGAGDAFDAGLLCALLDGRPLDDALAFACACGTLSMRAAGGTAAQPTLAEARAVSRQA